MRTADDLFATPQGSPRTDKLNSRSVQWVERIMEKIHVMLGCSLAWARGLDGHEKSLPALVRLPAEIEVYSQSVAHISYNSVPFFSSDNVSPGGGFLFLSLLYSRSPFRKILTNSWAPR